MRYILFDNSTLTAIQRVLGGIKLRNKYIIDADILALENYIQSILFYDKIIYIDDYKEYFRESRKSFFPDMYAYSVSDSVYNRLLSEAKRLCEDIIPRVESGHMTDADFKPFLDLLKLNITYTWDMSSSDFYLTVKMLETVGGLDTDKYGKLFSMIRQELLDKNVSHTEIDEKFPLLYASNGERVIFNEEYKGLAQETKNFFASLNWLAFRTLFYTLAAKELGTDLLLYHTRHAFQINSLYKMGVFQESFYKNIIDTLNNKARETLNKIMSFSQPTILRYNIPMFTAWLAKEVGNPREFIRSAYELRKSDQFIQARQQLIELEESASRGNDAFVTQSNKLISDINQQMHSISAKYSVHTPQGIALSPTISVWNLSTIITKLPQIPEVNADIPFMNIIKNLHRPKGFKAVYKNIINDLTTISRLGGLHDIITSSIIYDEEASYFGPKVEPRKYYKKESDWKKPM